MVGLWKNIKSCKTDTKKLDTPLFLSYLEDCLLNNDSLTTVDLVKEVTYKNEEMIKDLMLVDPEAGFVLGKNCPF